MNLVERWQQRTVLFNRRPDEDASAFYQKKKAVVNYMELKGVICNIMLNICSKGIT